MIPAHVAVQSFHRDIAMIRVLRMLSIALVAVAFVLGLVAGIKLYAMLFAVVVALGWVMLHRRSIRLARRAVESSHLQEIGELEAAEERLREVFSSRGVVRASKAEAMRQLAALRATQRLWPECSLICQALIESEPWTSQAARTSRLLLLEAHLRNGLFSGAYQVLDWLYNQRLSLEQSLRLLWLQTEYESRMGGHAQALTGLSRKVPLIELMPAEMSGQTQAWLARSAAITGNAGLASWLAARAELLVDTRELTTQHPELRAIFPPV